MPQLPKKDACDLLDADHVAVKHLFVEYARLAIAGADADGSREAIARKICNELTVHAQIEEEIFYPALRDVIDEPGLLDHAKDEHQEAKDLIARIEGLSAASPDMDQAVTQLTQVIEHHVKEERDKLFPKARSSGLDLDALGEQLLQRQQELEGQAA